MHDTTSDTTERNSKQDAITRPELRALRERAETIPGYRGDEIQLILTLGGTYGLRAGEITHLDSSWLNRQKRQLVIPKYEPCVCGSCRKSAEGIASNHDHLTEADALDRRWHPKTEQGARTIPLDFDPEAEAIVTAFLDHYGEYPHSRTSVNRRVDAVLEAAGLPQDYLYPHALRASAATFHAYEGLSEFALQAMFGWSDLQVAQKYVRQSGGATAKALNDVHADNGGVSA